MFLAIPLALAVSAFAQEPNSKQTVEVPDKIKGAASESLVRVVAAKGVQIYECRVKDGGTAEWAFVAPEADLFDTGGRKVGRHYAGPRWESIDGSTITGTVKDRVDAPHADAIPWLLLTARSVGPDGSFSNVTSVQRVNTVGGSAPRTVCSPAARGRVARAPYTADYYFLAPKSGVRFRLSDPSTKPASRAEAGYADIVGLRASNVPPRGTPGLAGYFTGPTPLRCRASSFQRLRLRLHPCSLDFGLRGFWRPVCAWLGLARLANSTCYRASSAAPDPGGKPSRHIPAPR